MWRVVDLLDSRHSLVDRMENTEKLLKKFSHVEQRWMTEDIWEDDGPGLDEGEVVERLRMLEEIRRGRERIDKLKNEFTKIDLFFANKMAEDEKDMSDEDYRKWRRDRVGGARGGGGRGGGGREGG